MYKHLMQKLSLNRKWIISHIGIWNIFELLLFHKSRLTKLMWHDLRQRNVQIRINLSYTQCYTHGVARERWRVVLVRDDQESDWVWAGGGEGAECSPETRSRSQRWGVSGARPTTTQNNSSTTGNNVHFRFFMRKVSLFQVRVKLNL